MTSVLCIILKELFSIYFINFSQKAQHNGNTLQKMMSDLEIAVKTERDHQKWDDMIKSINTVTRVKVSIIMQASQGKTTRVANKIYG